MIGFAVIKKMKLSMDVVKYIRLQAGEGGRLKDIRLLSLKSDPDAFGSTYETAVTWDDQNWEDQIKNLPTFVAVHKDKDVGMVRIVKDKDNDTVAWLISMWVNPSARGMGVGSGLISQTIEWAKSEGCKVIKLDVADENFSAVKLYERMGFQVNGEVGSLPEPRTHIKEHQRELKL